MRAALLIFSLLLFGCAGVPQHGSWGARWPDAGELGSAAVAAAKQPRTWVPLAGAALLSAAGVDDGVSDWLADQRPMFGSHAADASDKLRNAAVASYLLSALAAPSESRAEKLSGLGVGIATLYVQGAMIGGLKEVSGRRRPNNANDGSFPSGHAGTASAASTLARHNLQTLDMPNPLRTAAAFGLEAMALGTGWARVEARKHYAADVLAGYAAGHFVASFAQLAFIENRLPGAEVAFYPMDGGGALRLTVPLARSP